MCVCVFEYVCVKVAVSLALGVAAAGRGVCACVNVYVCAYTCVYDLVLMCLVIRIACQGIWSMNKFTPPVSSCMCVCVRVFLVTQRHIKSHVVVSF